CSITPYPTHPPTTDIYSLSLHDALPICRVHRFRAYLSRGFPLCRGRDCHTQRSADQHVRGRATGWRGCPVVGVRPLHGWLPAVRSEEHTSELQSRENLVCRLLLEKKKQN